jgi:hypothetical protein
MTGPGKSPDPDQPGDGADKVKTPWWVRDRPQVGGYDPGEWGTGEKGDSRAHNLARGTGGTVGGRGDTSDNSGGFWGRLTSWSRLTAQGRADPDLEDEYDDLEEEIEDLHEELDDVEDELDSESDTESDEEDVLDHSLPDDASPPAGYDPGPPPEED